MDFGMFISAFDHTYDNMKNERKLDPDDPSNHLKKSFCRELLCQIAKNENDVLYPKGDKNRRPRSLKAFESYYQNSGRRTLHPIAVRIAYQPNRIKFIRFLRSIVKQCGGKELLLHNFQQYLPDTTARTLLGDITRAFVDILREAADTPDRRYKLPVPEKDRVNSTNHQVESSSDDSGEASFITTYTKKVTLSDVNPGIRAEIWKTTDEIINDCKRFKSQTSKLYYYIGILNEAKNEGDPAKFVLHYPKYESKIDETENSFRGILKKWGHLYTTFANIIEINEITQINFAHLITLPPDNKTIHVACDDTDAFIERLRQLSEDYLFT